MAKRRRRRKSRAKNPDDIPKGAYLLPNGNYVIEKPCVYGTGKRARAYTLKFECKTQKNLDLHVFARLLIDLAKEELGNTTKPDSSK